MGTFENQKLGTTKGNRGGLRMGEMERDALISHGVSAFTLSQLMYASDAYQTAFCKTCSSFAVYDETTRLYKPCRLCGDNKNFGRATIPYAYKLLVHLLAPLGINLRPEFVTSDEYLEIILRNSVKEGDLEDVKSQLNEADEGFDDEFEQDEENITDYGDIYE